MVCWFKENLKQTKTISLAEQKISNLSMNHNVNNDIKPDKNMSINGQTFFQNQSLSNIYKDNQFINDLLEKK